MRRALLFCAAIAFAIACGDDVTEPVPTRTPETPTVSFATTTTEDGLSISTDKDDYQPGDVVHFTGTGWQPGDVLDIVLTDDPLTHDPHTWTVNVAEDGTFQDDTYVVDEGDLNVTFTLLATSRATGRSLTVVFTDANPGVNPVTLSPAQPDPSASPFTASFTVSINGSVTNPWRATGWRIYPKGSASGNYTCVNSPDLTTVGTSPVLVLNLLTPSTAGEYTLDIQTYSDDGTNCTTNVGNGRTTDFLVGTPDLTITKTHTGSFTAGSTGSFTITVTNSGNLVTSGPTTVTDVLPSGFTFSSVSGTNWSCPAPVGQTVTCTRGGGANVIAAGVSAPAITLTVNVASGASGTITNIANVSGGGELNTANNSASDPTGITASSVPTTTTVTSSSNPSVSGELVTFTAAVKTGGTAIGANGAVSFRQGGTDCTDGTEVKPATALDASGQATYAASFNAAGGSQVIWACYAGSSGYDPSNGSITQTVNKAQTTVTLTKVPSGNSVFSQTVVFTADVTPTAPGSGIPDGDVKFYEFTAGGTCDSPNGLLATATLASAKAELSIATLPASTTAHTITACYQGSTNFEKSGNAINHTVDKAQTSTTVTSSVNPSILNQPVTFDVSVAPVSPAAATSIPVGSVTLKDGSCSEISSLTSPITLDGAGKASFANISSLAIGSHTVTACYSGNTNFESSDGNVSQQVRYNLVNNALLPPVDRPNTYNVSKAGQAVPLKWQLTDFSGIPVLTLVAVKVQAKVQACPLASIVQDQIEEYASGESGLQNLGGGYYQFNWKTPTNYASSCRTIGLDLGEGTPRSDLAYFTFKK
jgi:uncharacterized repeat protein (TIGR01451 family)